MPTAMFKDAIKAAVYGDLLMKLTNRVRPYEVHTGETKSTLKSGLITVRKSF